jgi:aldehyde dehydrogenase
MTHLLIGGELVAGDGSALEVENPYTEKTFASVGSASDEQVDAAIVAAHEAAKTWSQTPATERADLLHEVATKLRAHADEIAKTMTEEGGKPLIENRDEIGWTAAAFDFYAELGRAEAGRVIPPIESTQLALVLKEPLGVVACIVPWNYPLLLLAWKLAPALAAGNCVVLKPAEQTPATILLFAKMINHLLPKGVLNIVNGFGIEAGKPLAQNKRIAKIAFTGETTTGRLIMQYASENIIPVSLELGGKSPNIFFADVLDKDDDFRQKTLEGFAMFMLNQGEVCTCPSRALIDKKIYGAFLELAIERTKRVMPGDPFDTDTKLGAQASNDQLEKILSYFDIGKKEGAKVRTGGERVKLGGGLEDGYYVAPTIFEGNNKMRIFQEEIFGPVVSVTSFDGYDNAIEIANDTLYGLGAGVWTRDGSTAYRAGRAIQAGRVWTNCYHHYPAHAAFGGYKHSGIGRENHKMMLDHYSQTKNLLVSYDPKPMGFF